MNISDRESKFNGFEPFPGDLLPDDPKPDPSRFQVYSATDLNRMDLKPKFIFQDALVADVPAVIGGREKSLKSLVAMDLALSMASGAAWLGHFKCLQRSRCLYFIGEGGLVFARDATGRIAASKGLDLENLRDLFLCQELPNLTNDRELNEVTSIIKDCGARVVVFDPLYLMLAEGASGASNVYAMGALFQRLLRTCRDAEATPVAVHHFRKSQPVGTPAELSDLAQSGAAEFAGQWLLINRKEPYDEERPGSHEMIIRLGSRVGVSSRWHLHVEEGSLSHPGGRYWHPEILSPARARAEEEAQRIAAREDRWQKQLATNEDKIIAAMREMGGAETESQIRLRAGIGPKYFRPAFDALKQSGRVVQGQIQKGNRKKPYDCYRLAD